MPAREPERLPDSPLRQRLLPADRRSSGPAPRLPGHPGPGGEAASSVRQVALHSLIQNYKGPELFLDIDAQGRAIGIEIVMD